MKNTPKQIEQQILQDNQSFYDDLTQKQYPTKKRPLGKVLWLCGMATVAVVCLVFFIVFLPTLGSQEQPKLYLAENEIMDSSTISQLNEFLTVKNITIDENLYQVFVSRCYDKISEDTLYFQLRINSLDGLETIKIYVYPNKDYTSKKQLNYENAKETTINGLIWNYAEERSLYAEGIYQHTVSSEYSGDALSIYVDYSQISLSDQSSFVTFIQNLLQPK